MPVWMKITNPFPNDYISIPTINEIQSSSTSRGQIANKPVSILEEQKIARQNRSGQFWKGKFSKLTIWGVGWKTRSIAWKLCRELLLLTYSLSLIPAWISNYIHQNVLVETTFPFPDFNGDGEEYFILGINCIDWHKSGSACGWHVL